MRKILISLFVIILLVNISILAQTQEDAKYNFGSAQADKELKINPGGEISTKLYFYNIYGNRITHIKLEISEYPENWIISLTPDAHDAEVDISGILTTINENLYVEPSSDVVDEIPENVPEGIEYISSSVGYIGAKPVEIRIKVPENENYGSYDLRIDASAFWLGQEGTAEIQQSRSFDYKINVVSEIFYEIPAGKTFDIDFSTLSIQIITGTEGTIKTFSLDGVTEHTLTFKEITQDSVILIIESDSIEVVLKIDETKKVDIDNDNVDDLEIKLNSIDNGVADLTLKKISEGKELDLVGITGGVIGANALTTGILTLTTLILIIVILILVSVARKQKLSKK